MYKHARGLHNDDSGPRQLVDAVVAFRHGHAGSVPCVYRRVWAETTAVKAQTRWSALPDVYCDGYLIVDGEIADCIGDGAAVEEWTKNRKGLNRGVDPIMGTKYVDREAGGKRDDRWLVVIPDDRLDVKPQV